MNAIDTISRIIETYLATANLKYCFVDRNKLPFRIDGTPARTNTPGDFSDLKDLVYSPLIADFAGVGVSIQASKLTAIDVDKCFSVANDIGSADERAKDIIRLFGSCAYCEFSFSGYGLRVLFRQKTIDNYCDLYYIKNKNTGIEFYQPDTSYRYVTVTGRTIIDSPVDSGIDFRGKIRAFLDKYMLRPVTVKEECELTDYKTFDECMRAVKQIYLTNGAFQNLWFENAPGSGKDESERDFHLCAFLYENITQDRKLLKRLFEQSEFFKTKDKLHRKKWESNNFRYYNYLYDVIKRAH